MTNKGIAINQYKGITSDSRAVKPGFIYVSIKGEKVDGDDCIEQALSNGASLVVVRKNSRYKGDKALRVENPRAKLAKLSNEFYQPQPSNIVAVTGTSGKTSVAFFYKQIAELLGLKSASIGTLGLVSNYASIEVKDSLTSPDPVTLNKILQKLASSDITHVAMEASSHGIAQYRIDGINLQAAAFTNLSQDHLDYHKNMEEYLDAKLKLFTEFLKRGYAILNADVLEFKKISSALKSKPQIKILSYGRLGDHIKLISLRKPDICLEILGSRFNSKYHLEGGFQVHNLMAAIGLAISTGMKPHEIIEILPQIKAAPGRLELVAEYHGAKVFVDYAHKPDALEKALTALREECKGRLIVIFGCGGDRDKAKRPMMGEIATRLADVVIITDDNPRTEAAGAIRKEILAVCSNALEYDSRSSAIADAIKQLKALDILLIAGKGHETYQILGGQSLHFSDHEEVMRACVAT